MRRRGLRIKCNNPDHPGCTALRSVGKDDGITDPCPPALFLGAWLAAAFDQTPEEHKRYRPSYDDILMYKIDRDG